MPTSSIITKTEQVLEWPLLLDFLAKESASTMGAERCHALTCTDNIDIAHVQQQETSDMLGLLQDASSFPTLAFPDIREILARASKEGVLDGPNLRDISLVLELSHMAQQTLSVHRDTYPTVSVRTTRFQDVSRLKHTIDYCVDSDGNLRDSASPELHQFTQKSQALRQTIRQRLEHLLASPPYEDLIQGHYFAIRENRYVIPVKAERQQAIKGIVHDISSSGSTVFVEPHHLMELNNAIKFADLQIDQEVRRLFQDLSEEVARYVPEIQANLVQLAELDCLMAKARLSIKVQGSPIHLNTTQRIYLKNARHPLLVLHSTHNVVPNSIQLGGGSQLLIISGPNAGGKTASLKLVGLVALMVKTGLHPPCAPDSEMALFPQVYADIGDTQDLAKDVSSFSGHILNIMSVIEDQQAHCDSPSSASLVLLDEVGSSTDPIEGAALAEAILEYLCAAGCTILATTHYLALKTLALRDPLVRNASQEFDLHTLTPTYRLIDGLPGSSSALDIAERLGLFPSIIKRAKILVQGQDQDLENIFSSLQEAQTTLEKEVALAQQAHQEATHLLEKARISREEFEAQKNMDRQRYRKQWQQEFSKARRQLTHLQDSLKKESTLSNIRATRQELKNLNNHLASQLPPRTDEVQALPQKGDLVEIDSFGTPGVLLEDLEGKKTVSLRMGSHIIMTPPESLRLAEARSQPTNLPKQTPLKPTNSSPITPPDISSRGATVKTAGSFYQQEVDIRGSRVDEALKRIIAALDQAIIRETNFLKVIHGQGTGVLKTSLRKYCETSPYLKSYRRGEPDEGGEGVTILELR